MCSLRAISVSQAMCSVRFFVGQMVSPSTPQEKPDGTKVHTLWGDLAWQIGGIEGYEMVAEDDRNATNPGAKLIELFERFGPDDDSDRRVGGLRQEPADENRRDETPRRRLRHTVHVRPSTN